MNKNRFCKIIREIQKSNDLQHEIANLIQKYNNYVRSDYPERYGIVVSHDFTVVELLEEIMDDKYEDISYFCYELNYGADYKPGTVTDENGNEIDFSTPEKLYDYLVKRKENDEN